MAQVSTEEYEGGTSRAAAGSVLRAVGTYPVAGPGNIIGGDSAVPGREGRARLVWWKAQKETHARMITRALEHEHWVVSPIYPLVVLRILSSAGASGSAWRWAHTPPVGGERKTFRTPARPSRRK